MGPKEDIGRHIRHKEGSNAYLSDLILGVFHWIRQDPNPHFEDDGLQDLLDEFSASDAQVQELQLRWSLSQKLVAFNSKVLECYPQARWLGFSKGNAALVPPRVLSGLCWET